MKPLRRFCAMSLMMFMLALPALAGEMNTPPEAPPGDQHGPDRMSNDVKLSLTSDLALAVHNIIKLVVR